LSNNNRYLFNGKEVQTDLANQYDYGARFYDPVIGRWTSVDLIAMNHYNLTPYGYAIDNPILYIDRFGLDTGKVNFNNNSLKEVVIRGKKPQKALFINLHARWDPDHGFKRRDNYPGTDYCNCPVFARNYDRVMGKVLPILLIELGGEFLFEFQLSFSDEELLANLPPGLRASYEADVMNLQSVEDEMRAAGKTPEEIATTLNDMRRQLGVKYKDMTAPDLRQKIYERNIKVYGDKLGPTIDYLRGKGYSWEEIIEKAKRPGGKDLGF